MLAACVLRSTGPKGWTVAMLPMGNRVLPNVIMSEA